MKTKYLSRTLLAASFAFLTACGGGIVDGSGCISGCDTPSALAIFAESSQTSNVGISPLGTWNTACYVQNDNSGNTAAYVREQVIFIGELDSNNTDTGRTLVTWTSKSYDSTDTSCSGNPSATLIIFNSLVTSVRDQITISGWVDESSTLTNAPQRADTTGALTAQPKTTVLKVTSGATTLGATFYIDDTSSQKKMYRLGSLTGNNIADDAYLTTANPFLN